MVVPNWLLRETFMVEHNPNCPSPFLVRLVAKGKGYIRRNSDDVRGYGQTLEDAATMAMKLAGKFTAVETSSSRCVHPKDARSLTNRCLICDQQVIEQE